MKAMRPGTGWPAWVALLAAVVAVARADDTAREQLNGILWMQQSAEYAALTSQVIG